MSNIPDFNEQGQLDEGDYAVRFDELRASTLVTGPKYGSGHWDNEWRLTLIDNCEKLVD